MKDQDSPKRKPPARKRKAPEDGERKSIAFRVTPRVYNFLVEASEASGQSISRIVEVYLEKRIENVGRQSLEDVFIGQYRSIEMLRHYAMIFAFYDRSGDWSKNEPTRAAILSAMAAINSQLMPLDTAFGPGVDPSAPGVSEMNFAWAAGAQTGMLMAGPLTPTKIAETEK